MDKLTTERLHQYQKSFDARDDHQGDFRVDDVRAMVRELLSLRTDAGDEEVLYLRAVVCNGIWSKDKRDHEEADKAIDRIVSKAVSLRNELRSAREEIENLRLERAGAVACMDSRLQQIATLTAERDQLKSDRETVISKIQALDAELAAIRSCPEMGEVDLLAYWPDHEFKSQQYPKIQQLADLARRAIASHAAEKQRAEEEQHARVLAEKQRDEIIIDLNAVDRVDYLGELRHMAAYTGSKPSDAIFAARRILAICGKGDG